MCQSTDHPSSVEYLAEAAYKDNPNLAKIEKEFKAIIDECEEFYAGMKKRNLNPLSPNHVVQYYYSNNPEKDGTRVTQYNEHLKRIEDLFKKMFHFRTVKIEFQLLSIIGPHTQLSHKNMFHIPVMMQNGSVKVKEMMDIGQTKDGKKWRVGYPTTVQASVDGIIDLENAINIDVKLQMYENMNAREYVAIVLHEIGHNLDITFINMEVKNDKKMIKVLNTVHKRPPNKPLPNATTVLIQVAKSRFVDKKNYEDTMSDVLSSIVKKLQYGGKHQHGELLADTLPTAFGYGPDLIRALHKLSPDVNEKFNKSLEIKNIFQVMKTYRQAIQIIGRLSSKEASVHGSNIHRMKQIINQLEEDLKKTKDSKIRARIKANIEDLKIIYNGMIDDPDKSTILSNMFRTWAEHIKL